jgi:predicted glutamine amidotransferase
VAQPVDHETHRSEGGVTPTTQPPNARLTTGQETPMCVIVIKPANFSLSESDVEDMFFQNSDGLGVMYHDPDTQTVQVRRALPTAKNVWPTYQRLVPHDKEVVIHFRFATHGAASKKNTHPFEVTDGLYLCHNGVLSTSSLNLKCGKGTDTTAYIRQYIKPMLALAANPFELAHSPEFRAVIGEHIGHNKFVSLSADGRLSVVNQHLGKFITRDKTRLWVSNTNWERMSWYEMKPKARAITHSTAKSYDDWYLPSIKDEEPQEFIGSDASAWLFDVDQAFYEQGLDTDAWLDSNTLLEFFYDDAVGITEAYRVLEQFQTRQIDVDTFADIVVGSEMITKAA